MLSLAFRGMVQTKFQEFLFIFVPCHRIPVIFFLAEGFGTEFREFSVPRNSPNSVRNTHLFRLFRLPQNYFFVGNSQP
jgi:hypothetical protein